MVDTTGNRLLDALPRSDASSFLEGTETIRLWPHDLLYGPGEAIAKRSDTFRAYVDSDGELRQILLGYTQALFAQISQSVACNGAHPIQERCARRLLESHDRVPTDQFGLTQEFLADMLAVQRPSVTVAARALQQAGLIRYTRGQITVLDREGLEAAACGCYRMAKEEYERVVPI